VLVPTIGVGVLGYLRRALQCLEAFHIGLRRAITLISSVLISNRGN